ncbi:prepilin-type N-terminal cleavage/methylation domain-containing protein [Pseudomonas aeruginosa]|uniref:pilus assembly FimT family protein n=1 Tax=Pseudomonas aeruginosa TaxID=287 RepID=UPI001B82CFEA|nr:prepilin-type N-terminal cleavage/methylation domain-containing protein [Pseudomonas aeruginosa]MBR7204258.1 prepilin-type N-terminal cleavage/methylation domain-containing protein [Pseudomonas aeruginosa]MCM5669515.1 prepilin-type N-terminal cleavage/methylation domain-containing protein [Pseudomonas aeruginosa]HBN7642843.1 prepilin-type N-terminal cleavage/methylation domain-containing protein [Pseudomonas aeruginosa]HBN7782470.1 prepilin-type N-terminal cleavage/methylation domain-contain
MYSRSRGFTLVELMVIVVLLGVMVAFAIPSFVNLIKGNSMASARNDLQKSLDYARAMAMTNKTGAQVCVADGTITISNARKAEKIITGGSGDSVQYGFKYDWEVASKLSSKEYKVIGSNGLDSGCVVFAYNGSIPEIAKKAPKSPKPPISSEGKCDTSSSPPPYVNKDGFFGRSDGSADPEWELIFNGAGFYVVRKPGEADFTSEQSWDASGC